MMYKEDYLYQNVAGARISTDKLSESKFFPVAFGPDNNMFSSSKIADIHIDNISLPI